MESETGKSKQRKILLTSMMEGTNSELIEKELTVYI